MDFWTARSERITAIFSTVAAVVILAGGVTAFQSHHAPVSDVVQLESDFRFQLEIGFRHDVNERAQRLGQLEKVSQAWKQSPRTEANQQELAKWLLEATIRSMPGSIEALPAAPGFGEQALLPVVEQSTDVLVEPTIVPEHVEDTASETLAPTPIAAPTVSFLSPTPLVEKGTELLAAPQPEFIARPVIAQKVIQKASETRIRVNLTELSARIAGYHEGLDEIERTLLALDAKDTSSLATQIRLLEDMARDYRFVNLYYRSLTKKERRAVSVPRPMTATLVEIERRIDRTQKALSGDFLGEFDAKHQDQIAGLRQQLQGVSGRLDW